MSYRFGDWVAFDPGYTVEVGRVTECHERNAFVCYTKGCTAASTPLEHLRPATAEEVRAAGPGIGFHRFDATCPERDERYCGACRAARA